MTKGMSRVWLFRARALLTVVNYICLRCNRAQYRLPVDIEIRSRKRMLPYYLQGITPPVHSWLKSLVARTSPRQAVISSGVVLDKLRHLPLHWRAAGPGHPRKVKAFPVMTAILQKRKVATGLGPRQNGTNSPTMAGSKRHSNADTKSAEHQTRIPCHRRYHPEAFGNPILVCRQMLLLHNLKHSHLLAGSTQLSWVNHPAHALRHFRGVHLLYTRLVLHHTARP